MHRNMSSSNNTSLFDALKQLSDSDMLPMHMPGHKRSAELSDLGAAFDITEINGFDDLHDPKGIIKNIEDRAASLWGARRSRILVGGSTCGILAAVYSITQHGDKIIMARGCHRSVYHAAELRGLETVYVSAPINEKSGIAGSVSPQTVRKAIDENPDAVLVIITSPTYEGIISDIAEIADIAHAANIPLIVDEAHGAHLGMGDFERGAVRCGADIVVRSLHKTLSCLTQSAILHICSTRVDDRTISHAIDIFETSSPSYLIMASIDRCINQIEHHGVCNWADGILTAAKKLEKLKKLQLHKKTCSNDVYACDASKFTVLTNGKITGFKLAEVLRTEYNIEVEMAAAGYIVAMSGMGDTSDSLNRFANALLDIDSRAELFSDNAFEHLPGPVIPFAEMGISDAILTDSEIVDANACIGRTSAEYIMAYPPGIPLIVPGERFTDEIVGYAVALKRMGASIKSDTGCAPRKYMVLK